VRTWVKFCGCTSPDDVRAAADAGADAFGMIFARSPRRIALQAAEAIARRRDRLALEAVAVVADPSSGDLDAIRALFPDAWLQFSGNETPEFVSRWGGRVMKTIHVNPHDDAVALERSCREFPAARILFDTQFGARPGGSGRTFAWSSIGGIASQRDVIVAGGLNAENVGACVAGVRPFGVDVRSGIETAGRKDPAKMRAFVRAVREAAA